MVQTTHKTQNPKAESPIRPDRELHPGKDVVNYAKAYARQKPDVAALWCFGIGFVLGWKVKPW